MKKAITQTPDVVTIGGRFGWSLCKALAQKYPDWKFLFIMRDEKKVEEAQTSGLVKEFFIEKAKQSGKNLRADQFKLPDNVSFHSLADFNKDFGGKIRKLFIPAVSSNSIRPVLENMLSKGIEISAFQNCEVLSVAKGMENSTLLFPHEVIDDIIETDSVVALGGNLAFDFALYDPMLMELAGKKKSTRRVADFFIGSNLIIYETKNRRKLSLAGPMKNIHSLATGMTNEIYGNSSVSTIATMGLSEYERAAFIIQFRKNFRPLARQLQKLPVNFRSVPIAGGAMSDYHLFRFTRNFDAGQEFVKQIKKGRDAEQAMKVVSKGKTIESFASAIPTRDYLRKMGCFSPVIEMIAHILTDKIKPELGIKKIIQQKNLFPS